MKKVIKIFDILLTSILVLLLIINLYSIFSRFVLKKDLPKIFGLCTAEIIGGSMEPTLSIGDYVVYYSPNEYHIDDIVLYRDSDDNLVTHRIVDIDKTGYIIAGDYTKSREPGISKDRLEAKYLFRVPKIFNFVRKPLVMFGVIVIGFILIEVSTILKNKKVRKKE